MAKDVSDCAVGLWLWSGSEPVAEEHAPNIRAAVTIEVPTSSERDNVLERSMIQGSHVAAIVRYSHDPS